jgi:hypothetical protein
MASRGAIAGLDKEARERIDAAVARLVSGLGVDAPPAPETARQPDLQAVYNLQSHATFLEAIANAVDGTNVNAQATPPVEESEANWPAWYRNEVEKADGETVPPLFEGESRKAYKARVSTLPEPTDEIPADVEADAESEGAEIAVDETATGEDVVVTESINGDVPLDDATMPVDERNAG